MNQGAENRITSRIKFQILMDYSDHESILFDFCNDLSTGGVFIETITPLPVGTKVNISFTLPPHNQPFKSKALVRWIRTTRESSDKPAGMGVLFVGQSDEERKTLEDHIKFYKEFTEKFK